MGRQKGLPKTGGKRAGTRNKRTIARESLQTGLDPLDFLIEVFRDETQDIARQIEAAKAVAPYKHPLLNSVELSGGLAVSHEQALAQLK